MTKTATVKLTSAIGVQGVMYRAGTVMDIPEDAAKDLLRRGKAVVATAEDEGAAEEPEAEIEAPAQKPAAKAKK